MGWHSGHDVKSLFKNGQVSVDNAYDYDFQIHTPNSHTHVSQGCV